MGQHYEVPSGESLLIEGPANVVVKAGKYPQIGVKPPPGGQTEQAPVLTTLDPATVASGSEDVTLYVSGSNLSATSVLIFGSQDEPTTFHEADGTVSTIVKPSLFAPADVPVSVRNGDQTSNELTFTFTEPEAGSRKKGQK
jgi:IPT/TIG domain